MQNIAIIGELAGKPRLGGGGSSQVGGHDVVSFVDYCKKQLGEENVSYAPGYSIDAPEPSPDLPIDALDLASKYDTVIYFMGTSAKEESEGYDREDLRINDYQLELFHRLVEINHNPGAVTTYDTIASVHLKSHSLCQLLHLLLESGLIEGIVMGIAITLFVAKLRLTVVGGVKVTEEARPGNPIEFHQITHDMGTYHILMDASSLEGCHLLNQFGLSGSKLHIILGLGGRIAPFQPEAVRAFFGRHRDTRLLHDSLQLRPSAIINALRGVDDSHTFQGFQGLERFRLTTHRKDRIVSDGRLERQLAYHIYLMTSSSEVGAYCLEYRLIVLYRVWREPLRPLY